MAPRRMLTCGLVAPPLFGAGVLIQDAVTPTYDATRSFVSHLSLGPYGWLNSALLVVSGALLVLFAMGLRLLARQVGRVRGLWVPVGLLGAGLVGAGVFRIDPGLGYPPGATLQPPSWHGTAHDLAGGLVFLAAVAGCVMAGRRGTVGIRRISYGAAVAITLLFGSTSVLAGLDYAGTLRPGMAGVVERAYLAAVLGWVMVLARHTLRTTAAADQPAETSDERLVLR